MADSGRNIDSDFATPRPSNTRPGTPMMLWVIVAVVVAMILFWAIRQFGTRSSAEPGPGEAPASSDARPVEQERGLV